MEIGFASPYPEEKGEANPTEKEKMNERARA
jgi:hypothetical protein